MTEPESLDGGARADGARADGARADGFEAFLANERARTAAEQERRRDSMTQRVTAEDLVAVEQEQEIAGVVQDAPEEEFDPWINLLATLETRAGVQQVYDFRGNREFRVATRYILESVLGFIPERCNFSTASIRLGRLMRRLGWVGPKDIRLDRVGNKHARGYCKVEVKDAKAA